VSGGFNNPLVGAGGALKRNMIMSPNFSIANETGWAVMQNGAAYFFSVDSVGPISTQSPITIGTPGGSEIVANPDVDTAFNITTAIAGFLQAVNQFITTDVNEVVTGAIGALLLGTGTTEKMATLISSAFANTGAAIILESQNDAGTDTPVITFGTITTPDAGVTVEYSPIASLSPYAFLLYGGSSGQTTVTKTAGSGTIPIPASLVGTVKAETWASGSGAGYGGHINYGGWGGGGAGYSAEPAWPCTPGGTVNYVVGAPGTSGTSSLSSTAGNNSTLAMTGLTTVQANAGTNGTGTTQGMGGGVSGNSVSFGGGNGGAPNTNPNGGGGGGGGASGGPGGIGGNGQEPGGNGTGAGQGGVAKTGGGNGGNGGAEGNHGLGGSSPGGGAGGGSNGQGSQNGGLGMVRLTYSTGAPPIIFSIASAAGTDQFGNTYPIGVMSPTVAAIQPGTTSTPETWHYVGAGGQPAFGSGWSNVGGANANLAFKKLNNGAVWIKGYCTNATAANAVAIFTLPAGYLPTSQQFFVACENPNTAPVFVEFFISTAGALTRASVAAGAGIYAFDFQLDLTI
jgi:hypothetical protein